MKNIFVSDITLRAFEKQDTHLTFREKLSIAEKLDNALFDAIELPQLANTKESEIIYRTIATSLNNAMVCIPVGDNAESLDFAVKSVEKAKKVCLQVIMPVSTVQMEYFYHLKASAMQEKIANLIKLSKEKCENVEFVANDAFRAEQGFVETLAKVAFENGATAITICDDEGVAFPEDYENIVKSIKSVCDIKVYVQTSNAIQMAAACAVRAIKAGADGVKTACCSNCLESAVYADIIRARKYDLGVDSNVDVTNIKTISASICDIKDGQAQTTNESAKTGFVSNVANMKEVADMIKQLGYELSDSDVGNVFEEFKKLTAKKEMIDTKELEAIIASTAMQVPSTYHLINYVVNSGNIIPATANVTLEKDGEKFTGVSTGDGPIDAAFHAIEQVIGHHYELDDFQVHAVTKGRGAVGSSIIRLRANGKLYPGNGASTDIVGACIRAYINALNKIVHEEK